MKEQTWNRIELAINKKLKERRTGKVNKPNLFIRFLQIFGFFVVKETELKELDISMF